MAAINIRKKIVSKYCLDSLILALSQKNSTIDGVENRLLIVKNELDKFIGGLPPNNGTMEFRIH
jgi:hypothetical protein